MTRNLSPRARTGADHNDGRLALARWSVVAGGAVAYTFATSSYNVADLVEEASGFGSAGVFVLAVGGLYTRSGGAIAANLTLVAGLAVWLGGRHLAPGSIPHPYLSSIAAAAGVFVVASACTRSGSAPARDQ